MNEALNAFLKNEFGITSDDLEAMDEDELSDFFDEVADIEIGEAIKAGDEDEISERGRLACELEDYINDNLF